MSGSGKRIIQSLQTVLVVREQGKKATLNVSEIWCLPVFVMML